MKNAAHQSDQETPKQDGKGLAIRIGLVLVAAIALTAVARTTTSDAKLLKTTPVQSATLTPATPQSADTPVSLSHIPDPTPWQYDPITNKHYHQPHGHWHSGPPPANVTP